MGRELGYMKIYYKMDLLSIYKIINDKNIVNKLDIIEKKWNLKKILYSIEKGIYTNIDFEKKVIQTWVEDVIAKKNDSEVFDYSEDRMYKSYNILLYLNRLYLADNLNENTYYPIFKNVVTERKRVAPKFKYILKYKKINFNSIEGESALENLEKIENYIEKFYSTHTFDNLNYRRKTELFLEKNNYLENYKYAEFLIESYINFDTICEISEFLKLGQINMKDFNTCVKVIKVLNPILYNRYLIKKDGDKIKYNYLCNSIFSCLSDEIEFYNSIGEEMDVLSFLTVAPFVKTSYYYKKEALDCIEDLSVSKNIISYIQRHNLVFLKHIDICSYLDKLILVGNYTLSLEDKNNIKEIFKLLDLPSVQIALQLVIKNYLNNLYDLEQLRSLQLEKTKNYERKIIKNPYKFITD